MWIWIFRPEAIVGAICTTLIRLKWNKLICARRIERQSDHRVWTISLLRRDQNYCLAGTAFLGVKLRALYSATKSRVLLDSAASAKDGDASRPARSAIADPRVGWEVEDIATKEVAKIFHQIAHRRYGNDMATVVDDWDMAETLDQHRVESIRHTGIFRQCDWIHGHLRVDRRLIEV
jgi:hypothetical protein